jgi:predicted nucleotidyltransferase
MPKQLPKKIMRILQETKGRMHTIYSGQLRGMILFGSYARGDYAKGSDIDILMLLDGMEGKGFEREKYLPAICDLSLKYDTVISLVPMDRATYESKKTPLILNVMREGVTI